MTISANYPSVIPSLSLDFANSGVLDNRITFSRPTTGTYYNGYSSAVAEQNLLLQSQALATTPWSSSFTTATNNSSTAPDGTTTATLAVPTAVNSIAHSINTGVTYSAVPYTLSFYVKASGYQYFIIAIYDGLFKTCVFDLTGVTVTQTYAGMSASITSVGSSWYRCVMTFTPTASSGQLYVGSVNASTWTYGTNTFTGDGTSGCYIWGAQLEQRSAVTAYNATTTTAITNYIPVLQTGAINQARFDHDPVLGTSLGLLIEQQSTNLLTYSGGVGGTGWTLSGVTISATNIAPDGTQTAQKVTENTASGSHTVLESWGASSATTTYTASAYLKDAGSRYSIIQVYEGSTGGQIFGAQFDLQSGVITGYCYSSGSSPTGTITSVGNGWYRCTVTYVTTTGGASSQVQILTNRTGTFTTNPYSYTGYTGNGFAGIFAWGAQLEALAFPTSYIPTVASQVTRSADSASMTGTNFSSWFNIGQGTLYAEIQKPSNVLSPQQGILSINDGTSGNMVSFILPSNNFETYIRSAATTSADILIGITFLANTPYKVCASFATNAFSSVINAGTISTDTSGAMPVGVNKLDIGYYTAGSNYLNGTIKKLAYYPIALTSAQLQALTG